MEKKPYFFIPVEITNRELDYKINIARYICNLGFEVILGNPPYLRDELKYKNYRGVFLEKGVNPDPEYYRSMKEKGIYLYDLSDEGLGKCIYNITYPPTLEALSHMRKIFFWGEAQTKEFSEKCELDSVKKAMYAVGNPSFDLSFPNYKFMYISLKPQNLPKSYILVNMNFTMLFGFSIDLHLESCPNMAPQSLALIANEHTLQKKQWPVFQEWLEGIIQAFPDEQFLIRPHPTEISKSYKEVFGKYKNVLISKEGNVNYVTASAKLVLHKDCSTAMQSYLMGIPSISLGGDLLYKDYIEWPLNFSVLPKTLDETKETISQILKNGNISDELQKNLDKKAKDTLNQCFSNLGHSTKALVDIITKDAENLIKNLSPYKLVDTRSFLQKIKIFIRRRMPLHYKTPKVVCETFTEFTKRDITKRLTLLESIDPLGIEFHIKKIFPNAFQISKK